MTTARRTGCNFSKRKTWLGLHAYNYTCHYAEGSVKRATILRTKGATTNTAGNAIGHAVKNPFLHCWRKSGVNPWLANTTEPEMIVTMMMDNKPPNKKLLYFAGIFFNFDFLKIKGV